MLQAAVEAAATAATSPAAAAKPAAAAVQAASAGTDKLLAEGPPDGAFSHRAAVDAWMLLLRKVVTKGNFFLLLASLAALLAPAPAHACAQQLLAGSATLEGGARRY